MGLPLCGRECTSSLRRSFARTGVRPCNGSARRVAAVAPAHWVRQGDGASWVPRDAWGLAASPCRSRSRRVALDAAPSQGSHRPRQPAPGRKVT